MTQEKLPHRKELCLQSEAYVSMPFLHIERYENIAHCGELLSATWGVLFVLKTPFFAKKIQKHEILPCNKLLFSLSVQNEEISYKNS